MEGRKTFGAECLQHQKKKGFQGSSVVSDNVKRLPLRHPAARCLIMPDSHNLMTAAVRIKLQSCLQSSDRSRSSERRVSAVLPGILACHCRSARPRLTACLLGAGTRPADSFGWREK
ncbi:hypothetical protein EYF80_053630 [Liparis tanakae]|uniref:Uncharacterized protein n=1 Tax=Liparis tanakae TaxID=230148 RepID=A0A4Z2F626_9TELE|nr:hypothetical protein EYF80_053630 [Liparis tanakae]